MTKRKTKAEHIRDLRALANRTADAALTAGPGHQITVFDAADAIDGIANTLERRAKQDTPEPAIFVLPEDATAAELGAARYRQAVRRGTNVFLPRWLPQARIMPSALLRSSLFSVSSTVQKTNDLVLAGDKNFMVENAEIATFNNASLRLTGYKLCQFDRQVYAVCFEYYRDTPLARDESSKSVKTTFYEFSGRMGSGYTQKSHRAIRSSLLRLANAKLRLRSNQTTLEETKLLSIDLENAASVGNFKGSDMLSLQITERVAEMFGPGAWASVEKEVSDYDGLKGWLAWFYASHQKPKWLPLDTFYRLSGYESRLSNFRSSLTKALDKLKDTTTPASSQIAAYCLSKDGTELRVVRTAWNAESR